MLRRVEIRNYKSIGESVVELGPLVVFVGLNGAGKSNFLDGLAFVRDCLADSVELAFRNRGGIAAVRRLSLGHPYNIGLRLIGDLPDGAQFDYSFEITAARTSDRFEIARERCCVRRLFEDEVGFERRSGSFVRAIPGIDPRLAKDRLALFAASGTEAFRSTYDFLTGMRFYSIAPFQLREYQETDSGDVLARDGRNAAAVLKRLQSDPAQQHDYERVATLLSRAVRGIVGVEHSQVGKQETITFRQDVGGKNPWRFEALNMSDGTLRLLGLLLAVYQSGRPPVVAIEEPESTVHPAITELLVQVLREASAQQQILVTTHSPDLLDAEDLEDDEIRVVVSEHNRTVIAPLSEFGRDAIRRGLYSAGELLRINELNPDMGATEELTQLDLFGAPFPSVATA